MSLECGLRFDPLLAHRACADRAAAALTHLQRGGEASSRASERGQRAAAAAAAGDAMVSGCGGCGGCGWRCDGE
eukprot:1630040-Prymnesium_polylepis.1